MILLNTTRLILRHYSKTDAPFVYELMNSEDWFKYIGDRNIHSIADAETYIEDKYIPSYTENGYGGYMVILKETGLPIGACGLYKRPDLEHPDIGFAFLPDFMGKGYGFEAADGLMNYARTELKLSTILGITVQENKASQKLLEKIGLRQIDTMFIEGDEKELLLFSN